MDIFCRKVRKTLNLNFNIHDASYYDNLQGKTFHCSCDVTYKIIHRRITDDRRPGYRNSLNFVQNGNRASVKTTEETFVRLTRELQWKDKIRHGSPVFSNRQLIERNFVLYRVVFITCKKTVQQLFRSPFVNCQSEHDICLFSN